MRLLEQKGRAAHHRHQQRPGLTHALDAERSLAASAESAGFYMTSAAPAHQSAKWRIQSMDAQVADLDAVRQSLGLTKVALLGDSYGGLVAMAYAAAHPEHVAS
jgi:proline iminopeptidase